MAEPLVASLEQSDPRKRVLVVDDDLDSARMLRVLLKLKGYEVSTALDGLEALEAAKAFRPDVILMDLTLPKMNGLEVAQELRKADGFALTMIVAVSGHAADRLPQPSPFDCHLTKPVDHDQLMRLLAQAAALGDSRASTTE